MSQFKFTWGTGITLFICLWVGGLITFVFFAFGHDIHLVEENYYPKEEKYQEKINQLGYSKTLSRDIVVKQSHDLIQVVFPDEVVGNSISAIVHFYRPSTPEFDVHDTITLNTGNLTYAKSRLQTGRYELKIEWTMDSLSYYYKNDLIIR